jgi:ferredoxin
MPAHAAMAILQDPNAHMMFLKPSPPAASLIDNCMECGYCEAVCPSRWVIPHHVRLRMVWLYVKHTAMRPGGLGCCLPSWHAPDCNKCVPSLLLPPQTGSTCI